jgi:hypothetical protein
VARLMLALVLCALPVYAQAEDWRYRARDRGVHLRILRDYRLATGATANEPIIVIGGSAAIEGRVDADVVVVGGTVRVGRQAVVRGDVVAIGGTAIIDPGAQIGGDVDEVSIVGPDFDAVLRQLGTGWWPVAALGATAVRLALVLMVALVLTAVAPGWVGGIADRAASAGTSILLGIAGQLLFVPALVVIAIALIVSIIGIPLLAGLPLLVGVAAIGWAAGFAAVAVRLGRRLRGQAAPPAPIVDLFTGFVAVSAVTIVAHAIALGPEWLQPFALITGLAGVTVEYIAWTIGLGAAIASTFGRRSSTPPSLPMHAVQAPTTA